MNASLRRTNTHWLFGYQKEWLRWDLMAGLITAAVVIPKAMAFSTIAGLPVQVGLYTILVPMATTINGAGALGKKRAIPINETIITIPTTRVGSEVCGTACKVATRL